MDCIIDFGFGEMNNWLLMILSIITAFIIMGWACSAQENRIEKEKIIVEKYRKVQEAITDEAIRLAVEKERENSYRAMIQTTKELTARQYEKI